MGKWDDDKLDQMMEQMKLEGEVRKGVSDWLSDTHLEGMIFKPLNEKMIAELMERVEACESEEEGDNLIKKFFKDVYEGKLTPYQ